MLAWLDNAILNWFQTVHNDIATTIFKVITVLGEAGIMWIFIGAFLLVWRSTRWVGVTVLFALLLSFLIGNVTLKPLVARPRPCWRHPEIKMLIAVPKDYSFPSGHTMSSFAAAVSLFAWRHRWGIPALALAALMGVTRLYFYVHYPSDVLAGMLLGIILGTISWFTMRYMKKRMEEQCK